jgi:hypothetical protein
MFRLEHDAETGKVTEIQLSAEEVAQVEAERAAAEAAWEARKFKETVLEENN